MPTVSEFYDDLRRTFGRGTSLEQNMEPWALQALKFLERNTTFPYMRDTYFLIPETGVSWISLATIPRLKTVESLGYFGADGGVIPLTKINRQSLGAFENVRPAGFWLENGKLFFEGTLRPAGQTSAYPLIMRTAQFSEWPTDGTETHPLLEYADDLLKYQVLVQQSMALRKHDEVAGWAALRDQALQATLTMHDEGAQETDVSMEYRGGTGRLYPNASSAIAAIAGMYDVPEGFGVAGIYHVGG